MIDIKMRAYLRLFPGSQWSEQMDGTVRSNDPAVENVTQAEIDAEVTKIEAEDALTKYQRDREREYPSIVDVAVALAEKMEGRGAMWDEITALRLGVKSKYPKPS